MTKDSFIFISIIYIIMSIFLELTIITILLIYISTILLYQILRNKNRHIGISTLAATFTVVLVLYILGVIGNCHLCTTDKNGIIFLCNRVAYVNQENHNLKLRSNICVNELVWIWPKQN